MCEAGTCYLLREQKVPITHLYPERFTIDQFSVEVETPPFLLPTEERLQDAKKLLLDLDHLHALVPLKDLAQLQEEQVQEELLEREQLLEEEVLLHQINHLTGQADLQPHLIPLHHDVVDPYPPADLIAFADL